MATVKKIKTAQRGLCVPSDKRGGGVSRGSKRPYKSEEYKPGKMPRYSRKERREMDEEYERVMSGRKGKDPGMWHKEWDSDESIPARLKSGLYKEKMKKGGKVAAKKAPIKKAPVKKAKAGVKIYIGDQINLKQSKNKK